MNFLNFSISLVLASLDLDPFPGKKCHADPELFSSRAMNHKSLTDLISTDINNHNIVQTSPSFRDIRLTGQKCPEHYAKYYVIERKIVMTMLVLVPYNRTWGEFSHPRTNQPPIHG